MRHIPAPSSPSSCPGSSLHHLGCASAAQTHQALPGVGFPGSSRVACSGVISLLPGGAGGICFLSWNQRIVWVGKKTFKSMDTVAVFPRCCNKGCLGMSQSPAELSARSLLGVSQLWVRLCGTPSKRSPPGSFACASPSPVSPCPPDYQSEYYGPGSNYDFFPQGPPSSQAQTPVDLPFVPSSGPSGTPLGAMDHPLPGHHPSSEAQRFTDIMSHPPGDSPSPEPNLPGSLHSMSAEVFGPSPPFSSISVNGGANYGNHLSHPPEMNEAAVW